MDFDDEKSLVKVKLQRVRVKLQVSREDLCFWNDSLKCKESSVLGS